jgi:hypothetical protein
MRSSPMSGWPRGSNERRGKWGPRIFGTSPRPGPFAIGRPSAPHAPSPKVQTRAAGAVLGMGAEIGRGLRVLACGQIASWGASWRRSRNGGKPR